MKKVHGSRYEAARTSRIMEDCGVSSGRTVTLRSDYNESLCARTYHQVMRQPSNQKRGRGRSSGNRKPGNSRNQTFDSNGPSVRVRGNAYQVMEKYLALARDSSASGDRIAAENFYQHAEHYFRILNVNAGQERGQDRGQDRGQERGQDRGQDKSPAPRHANGKDANGAAEAPEAAPQQADAPEQPSEAVEVKTEAAEKKTDEAEETGETTPDKTPDGSELPPV